jgi:hypothetical protein
LPFLALNGVANELLDKAMVNANKFNRLGTPNYISMDANEVLIKFDKPQTNPYEPLFMTIEGKYVFYKNKERTSTDVISAVIDWGDGQGQSIAINGKKTTLKHKYSSEGEFKITIELNTYEGEYFEYARAVSNTSSNVIATSGRIQPQKVLWRSDCKETMIDDKCYKLVTNYTYKNTVAEYEMVKTGPYQFKSKVSDSISSYRTWYYWWYESETCKAGSPKLLNQIVTSTYTGPNGCITRVILKDVCFTPFKYSYSKKQCYIKNVTKKLVEEGNVPASMFKPRNMGYES